MYFNPLLVVKFVICIQTFIISPSTPRLEIIWKGLTTSLQRMRMRWDTKSDISKWPDFFEDYVCSLIPVP